MNRPNTIKQYFNMPKDGVTTRRLNTEKTVDKTPTTPQTPKTTKPATTAKTVESEWASIHAQLGEIKDELKKTIKGDDVKKLIKGIVEELFQKHQEKIEQKYDEKILELERENRDLRKELEEQSEALNRIHVQVEENENMVQNALSKANYNEQYSRKFNIKFHGITENKGENCLDLINDTLSKSVSIAIDPQDVVAVHRIPGGKEGPRPILIKMRTMDAKTTIMRKRSDIKTATRGVKITDDVTRDNATLISRLSSDQRISSAWYFNGHVYGQYGKRRIRFDIFDDVTEKLREKQSRK